MASASEEALDAEPAAGLVPTPVVENAMEQIEVEVVIEEDIEPSHDDKKPKIVKKLARPRKRTRRTLSIFLSQQMIQRDHLSRIKSKSKKSREGI